MILEKNKSTISAVDRNLLLRKLKNMGIRRIPFKWIEFYVSYDEHVVLMDGIKSDSDSDY